MDRKTFKIDFTGEKVTLQGGTEKREQPETTIFRIEQITDCFGKINIVTDVSAAYNKFDAFFKNFADEIIKMGLPENTTTKIFSLCDGLINDIEQLRLNLIDTKIVDINTKKMVFEHLSTVNEHVKNQIKAHNSKFKRDKIQNKNVLYVPPEEKSISLKWRTKISSCNALPDFKLVQATFQYISIVKTIQTCFQTWSSKECF